MASHVGAHFLPEVDRSCVVSPLRWSHPRGDPQMSRSAIALVLALAATVANAQETNSGQSHIPTVASVDGTRPFLFDGRMRGDGLRQGPLADDRHSDAGAIVAPPNTSQPGRQ
jgi:hypothetical protein